MPMLFVGRWLVMVLQKQTLLCVLKSTLVWVVFMVDQVQEPDTCTSLVYVSLQSLLVMPIKQGF